MFGGVSPFAAMTCRSKARTEGVTSAHMLSFLRCNSTNAEGSTFRVCSMPMKERASGSTARPNSKNSKPVAVFLMTREKTALVSLSTLNMPS